MIGIEHFPHDVQHILRELFFGQALEDVAVAIGQHAVDDRSFGCPPLDRILLLGETEQFGDEDQPERPAASCTSCCSRLVRRPLRSERV